MIEQGLCTGNTELSLVNQYQCSPLIGCFSIVDSDHVVPWVILSDGDGSRSKGFKAEWSTVQGDKLVVGGLGKEWTTQTGEILNHDPMWVKEISCDGGVKHVNWRDHYTAVRESVGITWPGYMIHEAVCWSSVRQVTLTSD